MFNEKIRSTMCILLLISMVMVAVLITPGLVQAQASKVIIQVDFPRDGYDKLEWETEARGSVFCEKKISDLYIVPFIRPLASPDYMWFQNHCAIKFPEKKVKNEIEWRCHPIYFGQKDSGGGESFEVTYYVIKGTALKRLMKRYPQKKIEFSKFNASVFFGKDLYGSKGPIKVSRKL